MSFKVLFPAILLFVSGIMVNGKDCGRPPLLENRIVGGADAAEGHWPWQVDVQTSSNVHICGGSIISEKWILSAAHCFPNPSDVSSYIIYVGRHQLNGFNIHDSSHRVRQVIVPSGYVEPHSGQDVALVELSTPITWSDYASPICLPSSGTLFPSGMQCYVTGWGNIRDDVPLQGLGTLQEVQVPIISQSSCQEMYSLDPKDKVDILYDMICAGYQEGWQRLLPGRFRRTPRLPDGERDLGSSWSGELWRRLRSQEQTRRVRQTDHLHRLPHQHGTGAQAVWPSESELVWEKCIVGRLSVIVPHPTSEISILENGLSDGTNN
ncbi:hypothetical protein fugu_000945 [Takifugu bimaculatus]|uniref:Peptidase S1 domain-containing protein n=1 Tax=Takifugu bimaculatus TaxID=433685 RepID=A0A4Z2CI49_9TELE|nr:hypothetical protein fugu_000945 [Takifugu bimaculatus]